jgi:hypothetical protein
MDRHVSLGFRYQLFRSQGHGPGLAAAAGSRTCRVNDRSEL